jgi:hypothetical protein
MPLFSSAYRPREPIGTVDGGGGGGGRIVLDEEAASGLNAILAEIRRIGRVSVAPPLEFGSGGAGGHWGLSRPSAIYAQLSGDGSPYRWAEARRTPGGGSALLTGGRVGTAYEANGASGFDAEFATIRWTMAGDWRFQVARTGEAGDGIGLTVEICCGFPYLHFEGAITVTLTGSDGSSSARPPGFYTWAVPAGVIYTAFGDAGPRFTVVDATFGPGSGTFVTGFQVADGFVCCQVCYLDDGFEFEYAPLPIAATIEYTDAGGTFTLSWVDDTNAAYTVDGIFGERPCGVWGDPASGPAVYAEYDNLGDGSPTLRWIVVTSQGFVVPGVAFHCPTYPDDLDDPVELFAFGFTWTTLLDGVFTVHSETCTGIEVFP